MRIHEARLGRFLSVDPLTKNYPSWSPYPYAMNRPIDGVDLDGMEWKRQNEPGTNKLLNYVWVGQAMFIAAAPDSKDKRGLIGYPEGTILNAAKDNGNGTVTLYAYQVHRNSDNTLYLTPKTTVVNKNITQQQIQTVANQLGVDVNALNAVAEVESPKGPFQASGQASILFERRYMYNNLKATGGNPEANMAATPDIVNSSAGGYGTESAQVGKLTRAKAIDAESAIKSTSWGSYQVMGQYYSSKYGSAQEFEIAMNNSAAEQFGYFVSFLQSNPKIIDAMKKHDWVTVARLYNGPGYKKNQYDDKMKAAFERLSTAQQNSSTTTQQDSTSH